MKEPDTPDVVGYAQIAARTGRERATIHSWRQQYPDWPEPRGYLSESKGGRGSSPWWLWWDIEQFLIRHPNLQKDVA